MPLYTYRCENCGVQFDLRQHFEDKPLTRCPECQKNALRKLYLPVGIVFKGSGFYSTDHRTSSQSTVSSSNGRNKTESTSSEKEKPAKSESSQDKD